MIPKFLYRGDDDANGERKLRDTIHFKQLKTKLINGGDGRLISHVPLRLLINKHVGMPWDQSNFLSFSANKQTAIRYGLHGQIGNTEALFESYVEYYENDKDWKFAVMELDTSSIKISMLETGVYEGLYKPSLTKFSQSDNLYRILLIDVASFLAASAEADNYVYSIENAERDEEWLVLPATYVTLNNNRSEYSSIFDGACLSSIKRYRQP